MKSHRKWLNKNIPIWSHFHHEIPLKSSLHPFQGQWRKAAPRSLGQLVRKPRPDENGGTTGENEGFIWDLYRIDVDVLRIENGDLMSFTVMGWSWYISRLAIKNCDWMWFTAWWFGNWKDLSMLDRDLDGIEPETCRCATKHNGDAVTLICRFGNDTNVGWASFQCGLYAIFKFMWGKCGATTLEGWRAPLSGIFWGSRCVPIWFTQPLGSQKVMTASFQWKTIQTSFGNLGDVAQKKLGHDKVITADGMHTRLLPNCANSL